MSPSPGSERTPVATQDHGAPASSTITRVADCKTLAAGGGETTPRWRAYVRSLGPGLVTGASDDDPSGIATYAQTGAKFGFSKLWVALITFPLMASVQDICDRTALATGKGLGELITVRFSRLWRTLIAFLVL